MYRESSGPFKVITATGYPARFSAAILVASPLPLVFDLIWTARKQRSWSASFGERKLASLTFSPMTILSPKSVLFPRDSSKSCLVQTPAPAHAFGNNRVILFRPA